MYNNILSFTPTGLDLFLVKVKVTQKEFNPYSGSYSKELFQPYNPAPDKIKELTDETKILQREFIEMKSSIDIERLKLHERKLLAVLEHELMHFFGKPYENNYYTGKMIDFSAC